MKQKRKAWLIPAILLLILVVSIGVYNIIRWAVVHDESVRTEQMEQYEQEKSTLVVKKTMYSTPKEPIKIYSMLYYPDVQTGLITCDAVDEPWYMRVLLDGDREMLAKEARHQSSKFGISKIIFEDLTPQEAEQVAYFGVVRIKPGSLSKVNQLSADPYEFFDATNYDDKLFELVLVDLKNS